MTIDASVEESSSAGRMSQKFVASLANGPDSCEVGN
ncbi:MAG: hypothetical protein RL537_64 [Actinomycetota bacterium]